ncbi:MAG: response regulator [Anaerolineae bacterium]|nr:response regulator [Anaerolineae bacterium]
MVQGIDLFFALFNNLAIFIALVAVYSTLLAQFQQSDWYKRQIILGLSFGVFAIGCMYAKIPVFTGVIVDQRNAIIALSGAFGGPISAILSAALAGAFRAYLGGDGVLAGVIGVNLAAAAGIGLNMFSGRFNSIRRAAISALVAVIIILPGFLFVDDIQTGWELTKAMTLPYGSAIFLGIFLGGLLLRREEKRYQVEVDYRNLFEKMPNGYAIHEIIRDSDGRPMDYRFISINPALERMTGLRASEFVGKTVLGALPDTAKYWFDLYGKIASSGEPTTFESYSEKLDKHLEITVYRPVVGQFASIFQDITPSKKAEEAKNAAERQLRQAQKMEAIGRLAGGIAHDFNNILVPINLYTELAMRKLAPDSQLYVNMQVIREAAGRAADLTRQILAFGRKQVLEMTALDLNTVVVEFETMLRHLLREDIEFQTILEPALYWVNADKGQIEQVLMNLVVNARDAMPAGGKLIIETSNVYLDEAYVEKYTGVQAAGYYVMLAVSDTGEGMSVETQQQIFEPFFTTKGQGKGTGLGLSTVFGIVKQHGGNIWAYSEPDKGTTFKIYLPRVEHDAQMPEITTVELDSIYGTETVLVVEDEKIVRQLVCETLTAHGYKVLEAQSPTHALKLASEYKNTLCLLLTDVVMPEMNGRELYQKIMAICPDVTTLYMSGYTDNVIVHHGVLDEGVNFLQKPFTVQSLTQKVRQVLNQGF